jgi:hypothetical protein
MLRHTLIDDVYCLIKSPACVGVLEAQLVQSRDFTSEHASFSLSLSIYLSLPIRLDLPRSDRGALKCEQDR